jgi:hypothetical protein
VHLYRSGIELEHDSLVARSRCPPRVLVGDLQRERGLDVGVGAVVGKGVGQITGFDDDVDAVEVAVVPADEVRGGVAAR